MEAHRFWSGLENEELWFQRCEACERAVFPARVLCPACLDDDLKWEVSTGAGVVYSYTIVPSLTTRDGDGTVFVAVCLDEEFAMISRLIGPDSASVEIGARVVVRCDSIDGQLLPLFTLEEA